MVFLITCDFAIEGENKSQVSEVIASLGGCCRCMNSSWLLCSQNLTSGDVYQHVGRALRPGDAVIVTPVTFDGCSGRTNRDRGVWEWFRNHPQ